MSESSGPASSTGQHLLLYDGVCGLCNRLVRFVLPRDRRGVFHFAALQSALGRATVQRHSGDVETLDTFYLVVDHRSPHPRILAKARAALFVLKTLGAPWSILAALGVLPDGLLDAGYDFIARRRYRMFGRYDTCLMPDPDYKQRFDDGEPQAPKGGSQ